MASWVFYHPVGSVRMLAVGANWENLHKREHWIVLRGQHVRRWCLSTADVLAIAEMSHDWPAGQKEADFFPSCYSCWKL